MPCPQNESHYSRESVIILNQANYFYMESYKELSSTQAQFDFRSQLGICWHETENETTEQRSDNQMKYSKLMYR